MTLKKLKHFRPGVRLRVQTAIVGIALLGLAASVRVARAQEPHDRLENPGNGKISIYHVQNNVYMLSGAGGNITVQLGSDPLLGYDGVLLVDSGAADMSQDVYAAIQTLTKKPIRYIINTDDAPDHVGGNEVLAKLGNTIAGGNVVGNIGASAGNQAAIIAYQSVLDRMSAPSGQKAAYPEGAWPTETYTTDERKLFFNTDDIIMIHIANANTDGNTMVFFRRNDVISTGDIFVPDQYPIINLEQGGTVNGVIDGLNRLVELIVPRDLQEGGTMIVPGHGRICDAADVVFYQEMMIIIRNRVQDMVNRGMTLEQVKAAKPTMDYDGEFGRTTGPWTTDMFVEAVYKSLSAAKSAAK